MKNFKKIVEKLTNEGKTIATMESCTGGGVANAITNVEGAGEVIKFSVVTYCNDFKIQMGVDPGIIEKFSVYSMNTAEEMSKNISKIADSNYGIGITGKLNRVDKNNLTGANNVVYISIYDKDNNKYYNKEIIASLSSRTKNKNLIIELIIDELEHIINVD